MELQKKKVRVVGAFQTKGLFYELTLPDDRKVMGTSWTLKEDDLEADDMVYKSMKKFYLETEDVTEYDFAMAALGSYKHWERVLESPIIRPHIDQWRKELNLKLKARAMRSIIKTATDEDKWTFQAMKYLADNDYLDKKNKRGRPSKDEIKAELRKEVEINKTFKDDAERIGLKLQCTGIKPNGKYKGYQRGC